MPERLRILIVEDEVLLLTQLDAVLQRQGHVVAATALSSREAIARAAEVDADLALVDVQLADGPTGLDVARFIAAQTTMAVVFMTANPKRIPEKFPGMLGTIAKPYTAEGLRSALDYLTAAIRTPPPPAVSPRSLTVV